MRAAGQRNHWLILGIAATVVLAVVVGLSLSGILDRGNSRRDAVSHYIDEVNAVQRSVAIERQQVTNTYAKVRTDPRGLGGAVPDLQRSVRTLRGFEARLRALQPPPDAVVLHRRLVAMAAAEARFAQQIVLLARYLPVASREGQQAAKVGERLKLDLRSTKVVAAQADAFDRFAAGLTAAAVPLRRVTPPVSLAPARDQEVTRLTELAVTASKLAAAVRARDAVNAQQLLQRLAAVATGQGNAVERKAIIAFDDQARAVNRARVAVAEERLRLDRTLR